MGGHRRQASSVGFTGGSMSIFDPEPADLKPLRGEVPRAPDAEASYDFTSGEDQTAVKARLSSFSFGSKCPPQANRRSPSMSRLGHPLLPSQIMSSLPSPGASPTKASRLSTPSSRPPSLLLTRATPLQSESPSSVGQPRPLEPPSTPPTPARSKRHSHTRSNSISLPNLKLSSRPTSLGVNSSPSFPSSPSSPSLPTRHTAPLQGARLKFEPSGRGAEAEREQDEYRRKALEKLTGGSPNIPESPRHEISLPDLEDDVSSTTSSARPYSGPGSWSSGRPWSTSSSSTPTRFSWSMNDDSPPPERWSTGSKGADEDAALGFGFTFSGSGSGSFTFGEVPPQTVDLPLGMDMGMPSTMLQRPSMTRNLSVLAEEDETEDGDSEAEASADLVVVNTTPEMTPASLPSEPDTDDGTFVPIIAPQPTRLRELHLVSSAGTPHSARSNGSQHSTSSSGSPIKGYGAIGRGRPAPQSSADSPSGPGTTPRGSAFRTRHSSGPRSSISYKRDGEITPSREWTFPTNTKASISSSTSDSNITSPSSVESRNNGWNHVPRGNAYRPCPRPKSLAGLGLEGRGAGRILGEVEEEDEEVSARQSSFRLSLGSAKGSSSGRQSSERSRDSLNAFVWSDSQLDLEMERDALREDVDLWRKRCSSLEATLDTEKKENGVLRERVRKRESCLPKAKAIANIQSVIACRLLHHTPLSATVTPR